MASIFMLLTIDFQEAKYFVHKKINHKLNFCVVSTAT